MVGDSCANILEANGPHSEVDGGDGADYISASGPINTNHGVHGGHDSGDVLRGGDGKDMATFTTADVDLTAGTMTSDTSGVISDIENVIILAGTVVGDDQANELFADYPDSKAYGMGGDDIVIADGGGDSLADGGDGTDACDGSNQVNGESQYHFPGQPSSAIMNIGS